MYLALVGNYSPQKQYQRLLQMHRGLLVLIFTSRSAAVVVRSDCMKEEGEVIHSFLRGAWISKHWWMWYRRVADSTMLQLNSQVHVVLGWSRLPHFCTRLWPVGRCAGSQQDSLPGFSVSAKTHREQQRWHWFRGAEERLWRLLHPAEVGSRDGHCSRWSHSEWWVLLAWARMLNSGKWGGLEKHSQKTRGNLMFSG